MNAQADLPEPQLRAPRPWRGRRTVWRFMASAVTGATAAALMTVLGNWRYAPAAGWDATAIVFCGSVWLAVWPMSDGATAERATEEDPSRAMTATRCCTTPIPRAASTSTSRSGQAIVTSPISR